MSRHKSHHGKQTHVVPSRPAPTRLHSEWIQITSHAVLAFGTLSKIILSQWLRATLSRMLHALVKLDHVNGVGWRPLKATSCILCECDVVPSCILCECDVVTCMLGLWRLRTCTSADQNAPARPPPRFELWLSLVVVRLGRESCGVELHIRALAWARKRWELLPGLRWCALPIVVKFV